MYIGEAMYVKIVSRFYFVIPFFLERSEIQDQKSILRNIAF